MRAGYKGEPLSSLASIVPYKYPGLREWDLKREQVSSLPTIVSDKYPGLCEWDPFGPYFPKLHTNMFISTTAI
jgi:hypothetical protein